MNKCSVPFIFVTRRVVVLASRIFVLATLVLATLTGHALDPSQRIVRLAFISPQSPSTTLRGVTQFWERLRELGYVEGQNVVIEARWAEGRLDRLPALMAEVTGRNIDVLVTYGTPAAIAAKNATSTVPIVAIMGNPVLSGLATSLARPGGNLTGLSLGWDVGMAGKWLELLQETVPRLSTVAVIQNPDNPMARDQVKELEAIAPARGVKLRFLQVRDAGVLDDAFERAGRETQGALVLADAVISAHMGKIAALAAKHRLPTISYSRGYVDLGGLMAYGPDLGFQFRRAADYVDKILKGAKPGDLPIEQPTKFELVVNLKTAKALGLTFPQSVLLRADEVIR